MYTYKAKNMRENKSIIHCKDTKKDYVYSQVNNDVRIQRKSHPFANQTGIIQRQLYDFRNHGKPIENLEQLNDYLKCLSLKTIDYSDFPEISEGDVNAAIKLLDDSDLYKDDLIQVIINKITENRQNARLAKMAKMERIRKRLRGKWNHNRDFIGVEKKWHIHTNIDTQIHLKYGKDIRSRDSLNTASAIKTSIQNLIGSYGLECGSGRQCFNWLIYTLINDFDEDLDDNLLKIVEEYISAGQCDNIREQ